jgi:N-methylhydantoinase B
VRIETGGGGGWGHPFDREPERVAADVRNGFVSPACARDAYGVVLTEGAMSFAAAATAKLRASRPQAKLFHRHGYSDVLD